MTTQERTELAIADDARLARLEAAEADLAKPGPAYHGFEQPGAFSEDPLLFGVDNSLRDAAR